MAGLVAALLRRVRCPACLAWAKSDSMVGDPAEFRGVRLMTSSSRQLAVCWRCCCCC